MSPTVRRSGALAALFMLAACQTPAPTPAPTPSRPNNATPAPTPTPGGGTPTIPGGGQPPAGLAGLAGAFGGGGAAEPNPRPYAQVITAQAKSKTGLFTTHQIRSRLFFEIPAAEIGRDMLIVTSIKGTPQALPLIGTIGNNRVIRWERKDNRILLRTVSYRNISSDPTGPMSRAVDLVRVSPILAAFNVEAFGKDSSAVIDVSRMFTGGVPEFAANGQRVTVDQSRSFIEKATAFATNVEIDASQTFTPTPAPTIPGLPAGFPGLGGGANAVTELYHYSIVKLPEQPMMSRMHDERVGYFRTQQFDFGSREQRVAERTMINRWRLECGTQKVGALCVPKKPITYYVDPNTPTWLVPYVKRGIEEWVVAFEAAGFSKGIVAAEAPTDNPDFSGDDASVSMVRWIPSTIENAVGPSIVDPRTGEILNADVQMLHNIMKLQTSWYFTQVGHLDPRVHKLPMPDSLMGELVQFVVAHEVGHTLGFPHNMKGSSMYPTDSVRSASWVKKMGHSPSIMDYARFNYVAQPEDRIALVDLIPRVGPYDIYAVKWGYSPIAGAKTPEDEKATLDAWARMQDSIPWYRFAADNGIQGPVPGETNEAVGDADAVRATELGIRNLKRVIKLVEPATTWRAGDDYADLRELYGDVIGQWALEIGHVARIVGGAEKQEKAVGQKGPVFTVVPRARQAAALQFLQEQAFATPTWLLDESILSKIEAQGSVDRIASAQRRTLGSIVDDRRMVRMLEQEAQGNGGYPLAEMLADLRNGLWKELSSGSAIDIYRRRLQRTYLEAMASKINPPPAVALPQIPGLTIIGPVSVADARPLLRLEMKDLDAQLAEAMGKVRDRTTRAHLEDARDQIQKMLDPKR
jgi:hypothetical protein